MQYNSDQFDTLALIAIAFLGISSMSYIAHAAEYEVVIKNHQFIPKQIEMTAGEKHRLTVINRDATTEEFESYELNREKIVAGHSKIIIFLPALDVGTYPFFGEFHEKTAQGSIIVK